MGGIVKEILDEVRENSNNQQELNESQKEAMLGYNSDKVSVNQRNLKAVERRLGQI